jgi:cellulose synthase/poly-beta-1,6-N-acetylglucosamine synthase-like glycosyltransferase/GGDEF domain-containing protein
MDLASTRADARHDDEGETALGVRQETVLVVAADPDRRAELSEIVEAGGWQPLLAPDHDEALLLFHELPADLVVVAFERGSQDELEVIDRLRAEAGGDRVAIICNLPRPNRELLVEAFGRRADDVIVGRPDAAELIARIRTRIDRRPLPRQELLEDPITGALTDIAFGEQLERELERVARGGRRGALGYLALEELPSLEARYGSRARDEIVAQVVRLIKQDSRTLDFVGFSRGVVGLLLPGTQQKGAQIRFDRLGKLLYDHEFTLHGQLVRITPIIGYAESGPDLSPETLSDRAWSAMTFEAEQRDLHPTRWIPAMSEPSASRSLPLRVVDRVRTPMQVIVQQLLLLGGPLAVYISLDSVGIDVTGWLYLFVLCALLITAIAIMVESRAAVVRSDPPAAPDVEPPLASAVIAAYLPNEAETIVETIETFLAHDYPNLQIILAYNTPRPLDVEREIHAIAARDKRFEPVRVEGSVSKAQNVNAALGRVRGEFVGLFDADHHPQPGSFERAWRWVASGVGVVQGHCVIRNGASNFITRLVAAEFEVIYAVSHPGRARLHGFGIFGGSNGYWRTSLLHRTRMRGFMLTEDIDSSMRVLEAGETIVSDPTLVSTELAPETARALWNQRLRWAQGWSQVSLRHLVKIVRGAPGGRQKLGLAYLLGWREIYPWISLQAVPLLVFWWLKGEPPIDWFVPIFVATTIITFSAGPAQVWYGWRLADDSLRERRRWFWLYLACSLAFYTEIKNVVARTAHIKEVMRDRQWKVTPRPAAPIAAAAGPDSDGDVAPRSIGSEAEADEHLKRTAPHNRRSTDAAVDGDRPVDASTDLTL